MSDSWLSFIGARGASFAVALGAALSMPVSDVMAQQSPSGRTTLGGGHGGASRSAPANNGKASESVRPRQAAPKREPHRAATMTAIAQAESHRNTAPKAKRIGTKRQAGADPKTIECEGYAVLGAAPATSCAGN